MAKSGEKCIYVYNHPKSESTTINPNGERSTECPNGEDTTSSCALLPLSIDTLETTSTSRNDYDLSDLFTLEATATGRYLRGDNQEAGERSGDGGQGEEAQIENPE